MVELVMANGDQRELFMAALLSCTSKFKNAHARRLKKDEKKEIINVTRENVEKLCPSWASSELMYRMIMYKVCGPIIDNPLTSIDEKVKKVKDFLKKHAEINGIEMPA